MDITIRKATPEDAYDYAVCKNKSWKSAYKGIVPEDFLNNLSDEEYTERNKQLFISSGDEEFYCVEQNNKIIGILSICKSRDEDKQNAGEIMAIYLLEEYWDKGYGRKMMNFAMKRLYELGFNEIIIWSFEANERANNFYKKFGFTPDDSKKELNLGKPLPIIRHTLIK